MTLPSRQSLSLLLRCKAGLTFSIAVGWMTGNTESEETQNRLVAARNKVLVISVDYRRYANFRVLVERHAHHP